MSDSAHAGSFKQIGSDEDILRRLPKKPDTIKDRGAEGRTATSFALKPRPNEAYPSWSRQAYTSPERLLAIERDNGREINGWSVAAVRVAEVRELGLDVAADPNEVDPGHCLIVPTSQQRFSDTIWSKLAKKTRIVYTAPE